MHVESVAVLQNKYQPRHRSGILARKLILQNKLQTTV